MSLVDLLPPVEALWSKISRFEFIKACDLLVNFHIYNTNLAPEEGNLPPGGRTWPYRNDPCCLPV